MPLSVTDSQQRVVWRGDFDAFGVPQLRNAGGAPARSVAMPLRMAGQYADSETGLYYNVHRYYDPAQGRYITPDPVGLAVGRDSYSYAEGNPLAHVDPSGLFAIPGAAFIGLDVLPQSDGGHGDLVRIAFAQYAREVGEARFSQTLIDMIVINNYHTDAASNLLGGSGGQFVAANHFDNPNDGPVWLDADGKTPTAGYSGANGNASWIQKALDQMNSNRNVYNKVTKLGVYQDISEAIGRFGQNTHTLADFYAHTNWVDGADRGGCVKNWVRTLSSKPTQPAPPGTVYEAGAGGSVRVYEVGYVPTGLGNTTVWDESVNDKLFSGTVSLISDVKSCTTDISCSSDKTSHGYWNKDEHTTAGGGASYTADEANAFADNKQYYWQVGTYDPANPPDVASNYGTSWYGEAGKTKAELKKGDRVFVRAKITNRHEMAYSLAIEATKKEIARLYDGAAGTKVGSLDLQSVFKMDAAALGQNSVSYGKLPPKK
jgi:RHS repeat-associated protein